MPALLPSLYLPTHATLHKVLAMGVSPVSGVSIYQWSAAYRLFTITHKDVEIWKNSHSLWVSFGAQ